MKEYVIYKLINKEFDGFLLCLSFDSIANYLENIEKEPMISNSKGVLLVDQLLVTGDGRNRFILCPFDNGKIDVNSIKNVHPSEDYRKLSVELLQKNFSFLHNSILTDQQKESIKKGVAF